LKIIDSRGKRCPIPIIECAQAMSELVPGESIELLSDDPATLPDLLAWGRMTNNFVEAQGPETFHITKK
jgi:TusA-related sulfurtransferase